MHKEFPGKWQLSTLYRVILNHKLFTWPFGLSFPTTRIGNFYESAEPKPLLICRTVRKYL